LNAVLSGAARHHNSIQQAADELWNFPKSQPAEQAFPEAAGSSGSNDE
jgi:hypothetical protein